MELLIDALGELVCFIPHLAESAGAPLPIVVGVLLFAGAFWAWVFHKDSLPTAITGLAVCVVPAIAAPLC